jgi:hypothetical protein
MKSHLRLKQINQFATTLLKCYIHSLSKVVFSCYKVRLNNLIILTYHITLLFQQSIDFFQAPNLSRLVFNTYCASVEVRFDPLTFYSRLSELTNRLNSSTESPTQLLILSLLLVVISITCVSIIPIASSPSSEPIHSV